MIIYKSTNKITGKVYIGQTTKNLEKRIKGHVNESKKDKNRPFLSSINKYGVDNFVFEIIDFADNLNELNDKEIYWINFYNSVSPNGYNVTGGGQGDKTIGTKELSRIISEGLKNSEKWQKTKNSEEYKVKMKKFFIGWNKGKKFSSEHKEKIWEKNKERVLDFNKSTSKKWIVVDKNNNIIRITGKEEYFTNLGMDTGVVTRMSQSLNQGNNRKRYNGYYCFNDNNESNETILNIVSKLDNFYIKEYKIYNRITQEVKILKKDEVYSFCMTENYDYSSFLRMIKNQFKSYKGWII
jgi:group I intron endonuclease